MRRDTAAGLYDGSVGTADGDSSVGSSVSSGSTASLVCVWSIGVVFLP